MEIMKTMIKNKRSYRSRIDRKPEHNEEHGQANEGGSVTSGNGGDGSGANDNQVDYSSSEEGSSEEDSEDGSKKATGLKRKVTESGGGNAKKSKA